MSNCKTIHIVLVFLGLLSLTSCRDSHDTRIHTDKLVDIKSINNTIIIDLKYATTDNFLNKKIYQNNTAYLVPVVAKQLSKAQVQFNQHGVSIKVWDAYRPFAAQEAMWKIMPDPRYVSNPKMGGRHTRGTAVDLTLVDLKTGKELKMPTEFDNFTKKAHSQKQYSDPEVDKNIRLLDSIMSKHGFVGLATEWWHYDFHSWETYPVITNN